MSLDLPEPSRGRRLQLATGRLLGTMLLFASLGPIVGGFFLTPIFVIVTEGLKNPAALSFSFVFLFLFFPIAIPMSLNVGVPVAILTAVPIFMFDRRWPLTGWRVLLAGVPGGLATAYCLLKQLTLVAILTTKPQPPIPLKTPDLLAFVCVGVISAVICTRIARAWGGLQGRA